MSTGTIKLVVVGDDTVGKTSLYISYKTKHFPTDYIPTIFDGCTIQVAIGTETWTLAPFDTADKPDYDRLRPLSYPQTDVFLVCFSVGLPGSFSNTQQKWFPELKHHCPGVPCILVATQIDLRSDQEAVEKMARHGQLPVNTAQGQTMARQLGAAQYAECSAKTHQGVQNVFDQAAAAGAAYYRGLPKEPRRCIVL
ncbi:P-loop containing nucleoside triphosphate hydrolase protein [Mycena galopus ATCC 62051]|nr:P-loop containing nucleoside triphosphate hydrolase protein [Mycena galopus ATCC 62051]